MELLLNQKGNAVPKKKPTEAAVRKSAEFRLALICILVGLFVSIVIGVVIYLFVESSDARTVVAMATFFLSNIGVPLFSYVVSDAIGQWSAQPSHPDDSYHQQQQFTLQ
jgi:uncharacterized membrane protein YraQ (UPF0718 family)